MKPLIDLPDFATARRGLELAIPEFYNFGFDCIDRRAREADKTAFVYVEAEIVEFRHGELEPAPRGRVVGQIDQGFHVFLPRVSAFPP